LECVASLDKTYQIRYKQNQLFPRKLTINYSVSS